MQKKLTASNIRYLIAMYALDRGEKGVRSIDIAAALRLSKPSVHNMMDTFTQMGFVSRTAYGSAHLTDAGQAAAARYTRYYAAAAALLAQRFPDAAQMENAVCALLAALSPDQLERLL